MDGLVPIRPAIWFCLQVLLAASGPRAPPVASGSVCGRCWRRRSPCCRSRRFGSVPGRCWQTSPGRDGPANWGRLTVRNIRCHPSPPFHLPRPTRARRQTVPIGPFPCPVRGAIPARMNVHLLPPPRPRPEARRPEPFPFEWFRRLRFGEGRPRCLRCGDPRVHRWGGFAGRRRFRCVACRRTFSDFTGTPLANLKRIDRWPAFCRCMLASLSVRRTGRRLGVTKDTAFRWRHRLLAALDASDGSALGSTVALDETWFPFSEKGRRDLDRPARRRAAWHRVDMVPIWVSLARDDAGRTAGTVIGPRRPMAADLVAAIGSRLTAGATVVSTIGPYGAPGLLAVRLALAYRRERSSSPRITAVRDHRLALRRWLKRFRGVATRYLGNYVTWHRFLATPTPHAPGDIRLRCLLAASFP